MITSASREKKTAKLLFVCSRNRWRSPTAEALCQKLPGYAARSAGTSAQARVKVTKDHVGWADLIFVMEKRHAEIMARRFGGALDGKALICLDIPDDFEFMETDLLELLKERLAGHLEAPEDWMCANASESGAGGS